MRLSVAVAAVCLSIVGLASADDVRAAIRKPTNIPAEGLVPALKQLAHERGLQVVFQSEIVGATQTQGAVGELTTQEALRQLLEGTNLIYRFLDDKTITILPASGAEGSGAGPVQPSSAPPPTSGSQKEAANSGTFLLAQATSGQAAGAPAVEKKSEAPIQQAAIQEVIVTAEKRSERLQDVPVPVTAISTAALAENNQVRLQDYYSSIPAFSVSPAGFPGGTQMLAIRGLSSGAFTNPTVGIAVDDVPFGNTSGNFGGNVIPDFDPSDLARIEVLRGPQGTLYGASSMGGLLKFVTVDPSMDGLSARLQADVNAVHNGAEAGYGFRGAVNVPVSDTTAIRASAFTRQDPGYIDNPLLGIDGVNKSRTSGGGVSALWRPSEALSVKLSARYQKTTADGVSEVDIEPGLGDLQQNYVRGCCGYDKELQAYSAIMTAKLGSVDLTSISGYNVNKFDTNLDFSFLFGPLAGLFFPPADGAPSAASGKTDKFTQEIRASIPIGSKLEWLIGGFYSHEDVSYAESIFAADSLTGAIAGTLFVGSGPLKNNEYAGFTDLTINFTDRFNLQVGARESHIKQDAAPVVFGGALYGNSPPTYPEVVDSANSFTYLVTPQWKISPDLMTYIRIASGYRPAVLNNYNPDPLIPRAAQADKTKNYEIGIKGNVLDHALSFDASLYYIDWKDPQIELTDTRVNLGYTTNGSGAKSEGVELSVEARPLTGLTVAGWIAYDDAELTKDLPPDAAYGPAGSRLPYGSRFSGNLSLDQKFPISAAVTGSVGGQIAYVGDRFGTFVPLNPNAPRAYYPAYTKVDLRAGIEYQSWTFNLYANNVGDKRGLIGGGAGTFPPFAYYYIQPRTIGLSVVKTF